MTDQIETDVDICKHGVDCFFTHCPDCAEEARWDELWEKADIDYDVARGA